MHASFFTLAGLCALAVASPDRVERRQANPSLSAILSSISSLSAEIAPPTNIAAELTGVPSSVFSALANPTALAALESQFIASPPAWFTTLPADAQSYILSVAPKYASVVPQIYSLEVAAGLITVSGAAGTGTAASSTAKATATGVSNSTIASSKGTTATGATTGSTKAPTASASSTKAPSTSSSAGAAPTNVIAAGIVGAVGFLGFALAL